MSWGRILLAVLPLSLLIGPALGVSGAMMLIVVSALFDGTAGSAIGALPFALFFGAILGLIIASPVSFVAGAVLLWLATMDEAWCRRSRWVLSGLVAGLIVGCAIALLMSGIRSESMAIMILTCCGGVLGAFGGWLGRQMLAKRISALNTVEVDVFT